MQRAKDKRLDLTDKVWGIAIVGLLIYEGYTLTNKRKGDTLSEGVWDIAPKRPLIPFLAGLVCGHFFWQAAADHEVKKAIKEIKSLG